MNNYHWPIPLIACAIVIGLQWYRSGDGNETIYRIRKKYWYAGLEAIILAAAIVMALRATS